MKKILLKPNFKFIIFTLLVGLTIFLSKYLSIDSSAIDSFLKKIPLIPAGIVFVLVYIGAAFIVWDLRDPLKVVSALLFGAYWSTFLISLAETVSAVILFNLSRYLGKGFVEARLRGKFNPTQQKSPDFRPGMNASDDISASGREPRTLVRGGSTNLYEKIADLKFGFVFSLRILPLISFRYLDLIVGLSKFSFRKYLLIVLLATPLRVFWVQFVLAAVRGFSVEKISAYAAQNKIFFWLSLIYLIGSIIAAFKIAKRMES